MVHLTKQVAERKQLDDAIRQNLRMLGFGEDS